MGYFKGKQFKKDIIVVAVGYYCRFSLSYRDVSEILKERGVIYNRAIDGDGHTLDFQLRKTRDHQAAYLFMKRLVNAFGEPTVLTTDKAPALLCAFKKLQKDDFYTHTRNCTIKHLNNLIEQDHRHVKRRFVKSSGFQSIRHASRTIKGIETIQALYKQNRSLQQSNFCFSTYNELQKLFRTA